MAVRADPIARSRASRLVRPLAPATYLLRNAGKTLPLIGVITLAVMLIAGIVSLVNSIPFSVKTIYAYSQRQLAILPRETFEVTPAQMAKFEKAPVPIERMIVARAVRTQVQSIVGKWPFVVVGLKPDDLDFFMKRMEVRGVNGRLPTPGLPEAIVSEPVSRNLKLKIGSVLLSPDNQDSYSTKHVKIVGIAKTDLWFMATSYEYHAKYHFPPFNNLLVYAHNPSDQRKLDLWAEKAFKGERLEMFAYHMLEDDTDKMFVTLYKILNVIIGTLVVVLAFLMGMLINIYQGQRLVEFGLLQALGYTKKRILRRVLTENILVITLGWMTGVLAAYGLLQITDKLLMYPNAYALNIYDQAAWSYTAVIPLAILFVASLTVFFRFRKFDPVGIVERRLV
ncbi:MAG TPA: ABC transporter permease [Fimbriimonadaceae bacterium]|nr:ABC transporter permease [Fimbriimonadaceae bacterium]